MQQVRREWAREVKRGNIFWISLVPCLSFTPVVMDIANVRHSGKRVHLHQHSSCGSQLRNRCPVNGRSIVRQGVRNLCVVCECKCAGVRMMCQAQGCTVRPTHQNTSARALKRPHKSTFIKQHTSFLGAHSKSSWGSASGSLSWVLMARTG